MTQKVVIIGKYQPPKYGKLNPTPSKITIQTWPILEPPFPFFEVPVPPPRRDRCRTPLKRKRSPRGPRPGSVPMVIIWSHTSIILIKTSNLEPYSNDQWSHFFKTIFIFGSFFWIWWKMMCFLIFLFFGVFSHGERCTGRAPKVAQTRPNDMTAGRNSFPGFRKA